MLIVLDSGPLGLLSNPIQTGEAREAQEWARNRLDAGYRFIVPEIADYEVRRELLRADKQLGLTRLNDLCDGLGYLPLTTAVMHDAAALWAEARNTGMPTAHDAALDGDVILAAQAQNVPATGTNGPVVVATSNPAHLIRYVDAKNWSDI